jgi:phenylalanine-4-hydroxylase
MKHVYVSKEQDSNGYIPWSDEDNKTWNTLITRQNEIVKNRACDEFIRGLEIMDFSEDRIPQIHEIDEKLQATTGWRVEAVPAVIQPKDFFNLLANKAFPAATFIRTPEELEYLQEPDIFHEVYGHVPLLTNKSYASFMEQYGKFALSCEPKIRKKLFRIFWFTIEFGLLQTKKGLRAYGGGILSSIGETPYCLENEKVKRVPFSIIEALRTPFRIDIMQPQYFILEKFDDLFKVLSKDIEDYIAKATELGDYDPLFDLATINEGKTCLMN